MSELYACRICLATDDVKLYNMREFHLLEAYVNLTGIKITKNKAKDLLPHYICSYCSALLLKYVKFKEKCLESHSILQYASKQQLSTNIIRSIRSVNKHFNLPYTVSTNNPIIEMEFAEFIVKEENFVIEVCDIKTETEEPKKKKEKKKKEEVIIKEEDDFNNDIEFDYYDGEVNEVGVLAMQDVEITILSKEQQLLEIEERKTSPNYLNSFYKCDFCYRGFIMASSYENHMAKHDPARGNLECEICKSRWPNARALKTHIVNTHQRKYTCKLCDHVDRSRFRAREHAKWHTGFRFSCKKCDAEFSKSTSYLTHIRLQHPSTHACEICGESFISDFGLRIHKKKVHQFVTYDKSHCVDCDTKFFTIEALKRHQELAEDTCDTVCSCKYCGEVYENDELLKKHLKDSHEDDSIICEECSLSFKSSRSYGVHRQRVHLGVRRALRGTHVRRQHQSTVCEVCGFTCTSKITLLNHQRIHTGEKPYQCNQCPKSFSVKQRLQIHIRTHTGESPYQCPHCPKAFKHKAALNRHDLVHSGRKPYTCHHCGKSFSQSNSMKLHVNTVHLKMPAPYKSKRNKMSA